MQCRSRDRHESNNRSHHGSRWKASQAPQGHVGWWELSREGVGMEEAFHSRGCSQRQQGMRALGGQPEGQGVRRGGSGLGDGNSTGSLEGGCDIERVDRRLLQVPREGVGILELGCGNGIRRHWQVAQVFGHGRTWSSGEDGPSDFSLNNRSCVQRRMP